MNISVIIPAYNEEKNLPKIINSLKKQTDKEFEIIVVDNNSKDNTYKIAKTLADKVVRCKDQGISPARNCGAKAAKTKIIAFLDADSIVPKRWMEIIKKTFEKDKRIAAVHGVGVYDHKNPFKNFILNIYSYTIFYIIWFSNIIGKHSVIGNNLAIKKDIFERVGGFDKLIVEDYYLGLKLRKIKKIKCVSERKMKIIYSSRRIEKTGVIKMMMLWLKAIIVKTPIKQYKLHDKL